MKIVHVIANASILSLLSAFASAQTPPAAEPAVQADANANAATTAQDKPVDTTAANAQARQAKPGTKADRLDLDTTIVTGNRELPKVLYIVPWKKAEIGDLPAQPFNTLLDEVLSPVDREVFKREVSYFHTVTKNDAAAPNAGATKSAADGSR